MKITVRLDGLPVFEITKSSGHGLLWRQTPEYVASPHELFPLEPNRPARDTAWVSEKNTLFECLPGPVYDSLPDAWGVEVMRRRLGGPGGVFHALPTLTMLAYIGRNGMGALDYEPELDNRDRDALTPLDLALAKREAREIIAGAPESLVRVFGNASSIGGAHPKATIGVRPGDGADGCLASPCLSGVTVSRILLENHEPWLVKFSVPEVGDITTPALERRRAAGRIEYAYHRMALAAGLPMERCALIVDDEGVGHFATRRFDRPLDGPRAIVHSLLSVWHGTTTKMDYRQLLLCAATATGGRDAAAGVAGAREVFRRAVFNVAAVVRDDHAKNHALLYDSKHASWRMAPAFDLTHTPGRERHAMSLLGREHGVGRALLAELGTKFGIKDAEAIIDHTFAVVAAWPTYAAQAQVPSPYLDSIFSEINAVRSR